MTQTEFLTKLARKFSKDRFAPGLTVSRLTARRNDKSRRIMDGSHKLYAVPKGHPCFYGSVKRYDPDPYFVACAKGKTINSVINQLSREIFAK